VTERTIPDSTALNGWRKSSFSGPEGGSCVEVCDGYAFGVPVRDSKVADGPVLVVSAGGWAAFVAAVRHHTL
jgi:hypothetical protein